MIIDDLFPREPQRTFLQKLVASCNEQIINHRIFVHLGRQAAIDRGISGNNESYFVIALSDQIETVEPVYERLPGWRTPTSGIACFEDLPAKARQYLEYLESRTGVEVGCISTGPERNQTIVRSGSRLQELIG